MNFTGCKYDVRRSNGIVSLKEDNHIITYKEIKGCICKWSNEY